MEGEKPNPDIGKGRGANAAIASHPGKPHDGATCAPTRLRLLLPGDLPVDCHLDNLVDSLVPGQVEVVLLGDGRRHEPTRQSAISRRHGGNKCVPSTDKMSPLEIPDQRFRGSQADQHSGMEGATGTLRWRTALDIPGGGNIYRRDGNSGALQSLDHARKRFSDLA